MIELEIIAVTKEGYATEYRMTPDPVVIGAVDANYEETLHLKLPEELRDRTIRVTFTPEQCEGVGYIADEARTVPVTNAVTAQAVRGVITVEAMKPITVNGEEVMQTTFARDVAYRATPHKASGEEKAVLEQTQFEQFVTAANNAAAKATVCYEETKKSEALAASSASEAQASAASAAASADATGTSADKAANAAADAATSAKAAKSSAGAAGTSAESAAASAKSAGEDADSAADDAARAEKAVQTADALMRKINPNNVPALSAVSIVLSEGVLSGAGGEHAEADGTASLAYGRETQALGDYAVAFGDGSIAGTRGYYIRAIDFDNKKIYLSKTKVTVFDTAPVKDTDFETPAYVVGDGFSIIGGSHYILKATIAALSNNEITYTGELGFDKLTYDSGADGNTFVVPDKPLVGEELGEVFTYGTAVGRGTKAVGIGAVAIGRDTVAAGNYALAEGRRTTAGYAAHAEGFDSKALGIRSHAEGSETRTEGYGAHAEGNGSVATAEAAHSEGITNTASGSGSHAEGWETNATGRAAHAEGYRSEATGLYAHVEGERSIAVGDVSHAEGWETQALGADSHAEGRLTVTSAANAHAENYRTKASGENAHAEGMETEASGGSSHAEGYKTKATETYAHAEGANSEATGSTSHAEGHTTVASGAVSHAEGGQTKATAFYAHAEGFQTEATAVYSHAGGTGTVANAAAQTAIGKYNRKDTKLAFVVGNGIDNDNRSNAMEVDWDGNATFAGGAALNGNVTVNGKDAISTNEEDNRLLFGAGDRKVHVWSGEYLYCASKNAAQLSSETGDVILYAPNGQVQVNGREAAYAGFYGLGSYGETITAFNEAENSGFYVFGAAAADRPGHIPYGWVMIINRVGADSDGNPESQIVQNVYDLDTGGPTARRIKKGGSWSPWEYTDPVTKPDVEYRTTARFRGKPVYVKLYTGFGAMPTANSTQTVLHNVANIRDVVSSELYLYTGGSVDAAMNITHAHSAVSSVYISTGAITLKTANGAEEMSGSLYILLRYTKTTD